MAIDLTEKPTNNDPQTLPLVPVREVVIFPHTEPVLTFGRAKSVAAVQAADNQKQSICLVTQLDSSLSEPSPQDLYQVGVKVDIQKVLTIEDVIHALVKGVTRVKIEKINTDGEYWTAQVEEIPEHEIEGDEVSAMAKHLTGLFKQAVNLGKGIDLSVFMRLMSGVSAGELTDQITSVLEISVEEKQKLLEENQVQKRLEKVINHLSHEIKVLELEHSIASKTQKRINKSMREAVLRERRKTIDSELNALGAKDADDTDDEEVKTLKKKIKAAKMPKEVQEKADKELKRLSNMSPHNPEAAYLRNYLDWLVDMPWSNMSQDDRDLKQAIDILEKDHYGLEKVKERIIEHLAVMKLRSQLEPKKTDKKSKEAPEQLHTPTILCFVGPPGVGKTSIGESIAKALGRKFVRVSLGGVRDEAEIRGHRRTYIGSMPGRIIQGIKNAGSKNPVFMLDEIDKLASDMRGDPSSALLEALDPAQNREFTDHYLEVPFDLSQVMFIATANILDTIPSALRDRLEIIRFSGYTEDEKFNIATKYLWPKQFKYHGLTDTEIKLSPSSLTEIIHHYTREAGVRSLDRNLATICRKIARQIAETGKSKSKKITKKHVHQLLGPIKYVSQLAEQKDDIGMATGLAYTAVGGEILFIEVAVIPGGKGNLTLTGQLGDVMQESAKAAFSYVRTRSSDWGIDPEFAQNIDLHIHVPEGAVPKDGPSAGAAIATALTSALTRIPAKKDVAMTGEITLRGRVTEIGGLKEKLIAAHRAGIKTVLIPSRNEKDLQEIPEKVKKGLQIKTINHLDEVLPTALKDFDSQVEKLKSIQKQKNKESESPSPIH